MTSELTPQRVKISLVKGASGSALQVAKLMPLNGGQGTEVKLRKIEPGGQQSFLMNTIGPPTRSSEVDLFGPIGAPAERPPIGNILNTPKKPTRTSYQSMFEKQVLDCHGQAPKEVPIEAPLPVLDPPPAPDPPPDAFVTPESEFLTIPSLIAATQEPTIVPPDQILETQAIVLQPELINELINNGKVIVGPDGTAHFVTLQDLSEPIDGITLTISEDVLAEAALAEPTDLINAVPEAPPAEEEVITIGSDSEETELDEEEIEKLRSGYLEEVSEAESEEEHFSDFFEQTGGVNEHEEIVKEILEGKIKSLEKEEGAANALLDEHIRDLTSQLQPMEVPPPDPFQNVSSGCTSATQSLVAVTSPIHERLTEGFDQTPSIISYLQRIETRLLNIESRLTKFEEERRSSDEEWPRDPHRTPSRHKRKRHRGESNPVLDPSKPC